VLSIIIYCIYLALKKITRHSITFTLSPPLFSIYGVVMMQKAMEDVEDGLLVEGEVVTEWRFADDEGMVSGTENNYKI